MNHFMLPYAAAAAKNRPGNYGPTATTQLIEQTVAVGGSRLSLVAMVFGGACVLEGFRGSTTHLGEQNARIAVQLLKEQHVRIVRSDVGGTRGRKVSFCSVDGTVTVDLM